MVPPALRGLLRSTPTIAPIPHRGILSVFGPQASEFLNGLLATSIREPIKGPIFSTFLHAQGRVLYDVFLYSADSNGKRGYLLEYDARPSEAPPLLSYIKRHVLRSKVKVRDVSGEYDVWAAWGAPGDRLWESKRNWDWARSGAVEPVWDTSEMWPWGSADMAINDRRAVGMGRRLLVRKGDRPQEAASHDLVTEESYALHRILHGVPEGSTEIVPMQAFPMDSNLDVMGGLDFRKGCYVGQELTVRTYHTGVIRKRILPVVIHPQDQDINNCIPTSIPLPIHADIRPTLVENSDTDRVTPRLRGTGRLLTSYQGVGLALLRLEHVAAVEKGDARLQLLLSRTESETTFAVSHWCPTWWPLGALSAH